MAHPRWVSRREKLNLAIDHFLESLAEECGSRSAAEKSYADKTPNRAKQVFSHKQNARSST
jgi:hypothetical protein